MIKLEEKAKLFHSIIFIIWQLLNYYENLFGFYAGESAQNLCCQLVQEETLQKIRVSVPIIKEFHNPYTAVQMKIILNDYLPLLLQGSDIPPYSETRHKPPTESLYIEAIKTDGNFYFVTVLFIDRPETYRYFLRDKSKTFLTIIGGTEK